MNRKRSLSASKNHQSKLIDHREQSGELSSSSRIMSSEQVNDGQETLIQQVERRENIDQYIDYQDDDDSQEAQHNFYGSSFEDSEEDSQIIGGRAFAGNKREVKINDAKSRFFANQKLPRDRHKTNEKQQQLKDQISESNKLHINELKNENTFLKKQMHELTEEIKTLKKQNKLQDKHLTKMQGKDAEMPQLIDRMCNETNQLQRQLRRKREQCEQLTKTKRELEIRLEKCEKRLAKVNDVIIDNQLIDTNGLARSAAKVKDLLEEETTKRMNLEKQLELVTKNFNHQINIELGRQKQLKTRCTVQQEEIHKLKESLEENTKLLELQNIYSQRIKKMPTAANINNHRGGLLSEIADGPNSANKLVISQHKDAARRLVSADDIGKIRFPRSTAVAQRQQSGQENGQQQSQADLTPRGSAKPEGNDVARIVEQPLEEQDSNAGKVTNDEVKPVKHTTNDEIGDEFLLDRLDDMKQAIEDPPDTAVRNVNETESAEQNAAAENGQTEEFDNADRQNENSENKLSSSRSSSSSLASEKSQHAKDYKEKSLIVDTLANDDRARKNQLLETLRKMNLEKSDSINKEDEMQIRRESHIELSSNESKVSQLKEIEQIRESANLANSIEDEDFAKLFSQGKKLKYDSVFSVTSNGTR